MSDTQQINVAEAFEADLNAENCCPVCNRLAFLGLLAVGSQVAVKCRCCKSIWLAAAGNEPQRLLQECHRVPQGDGSKETKVIVHDESLLRQVKDWRKSRCPRCGSWFNLRGVPEKGSVIQIKCMGRTCKAVVPIIAP